MRGHTPKRLRDQRETRRHETRRPKLHIRVDGPGTTVIGGDSYASTTVHPPADRVPLADDVMPAALTTLPILFVILMLALTDQTVLLRSIVQEGNPLGLTLLLIPLFSPAIVASLGYFAKARGWLRLSAKWTNVLALAPAGALGLFVPLNYLGLQAGVFLVSLTWLRVRHHRRRWQVTLLTLVIAGSLLAVGAVAQWRWTRLDQLPRVAVGRLVDGLTRMNIDDRPGGRSVLVISVNDAYAIVATRDYPPRVETLPLDTLQRGRICQLEPRWNQVSLLRHWFGGPAGRANGTEACIDR